MLHEGDKLWFVDNKLGKIEFITVEKVRKQYFTFVSKRNVYRSDFSAIGTKYFTDKNALLDHLKNRTMLRTGEEAEIVKEKEDLNVPEERDMKIKCRDCGTEFIFTVSEQHFYKDRGFAPAVRCEECRKRRKAMKK